MRRILDAYKPAASARTHLLLASALWMTVGTALALFGGRWILASRLHYAWLLVGLALTLGVLKVRFVLDRAAGKIIERIKSRGDGRCVGGFLSLRTWGFVAFMMGAGRFLRSGVLAHAVVGFIYLSVGTALLLGTRRLWQAWYHYGTAA